MTVCLSVTITYTFLWLFYFLLFNLRTVFKQQREEQSSRKELIKSLGRLAKKMRSGLEQIWDCYSLVAHFFIISYYRGNCIVPSMDGTVFLTAACFPLYISIQNEGKKFFPALWRLQWQTWSKFVRHV